MVFLFLEIVKIDISFIYIAIDIVRLMININKKRRKIMNEVSFDGILVKLFLLRKLN